MGLLSIYLNAILKFQDEETKKKKEDEKKREKEKNNNKFCWGV